MGNFLSAAVRPLALVPASAVWTLLFCLHFPRGIRTISSPPEFPIPYAMPVYVVYRMTSLRFSCSCQASFLFFCRGRSCLQDRHEASFIPLALRAVSFMQQKTAGFPAVFCFLTAAAAPQWRTVTVPAPGATTSSRVMSGAAPLSFKASISAASKLCRSSQTASRIMVRSSPGAQAGQAGREQT